MPPPPPSKVEFPLTVELVSVTEKARIPPPGALLLAVPLPLTVELVSVTAPEEYIPPPSDSEPAVLLPLTVELLSVTPWLKPGGDESLEGYVVKTLGTGEVTGRAELRDSTTRELLLLIEGDKAMGQQYKEFTRQNNTANIEAMFTRFATRLRNAMDEVHGK